MPENHFHFYLYQNQPDQPEPEPEQEEQTIVINLIVKSDGVQIYAPEVSDERLRELFYTLSQEESY